MDSDINSRLASVANSLPSPSVRQAAAAERLEHLLDGRATFEAIVDCVNEHSLSAPEHHDTLINAFGLIIDKVAFRHPHTLQFSGTDNLGNSAIAVAHFSQVSLKIAYVTRKTPDAPAREMGFHTIK